MSDTDQLILRYYLNQAGHGSKDRDFLLYRGSQFQKGSGLFSALGGLFRTLFPIIKSGAKAVGKEALKMGSNVLTDIATSSATPKEAFKTRLKEAGTNLKRKAESKIDSMMGSGRNRSRKNPKTRKIKRSPKNGKRQSKSRRAQRRDIFTP